MTQGLVRKTVPSMSIGNVLLSKALRTLSLPWKRLYKISRMSSYFCFFSGFFGFTCFLKLKNHFDCYYYKSLWSLSVSFRVTVSLEISLSKVFIAKKFWKLYVYWFVLQYSFPLSNLFSIFLFYQLLFAFSGTTSLIANFWILGVKTSKASTCFLVVLQLFLFVFQMLYWVENI